MSAQEPRSDLIHSKAAPLKARDVHSVLGRHVLVDGYDLVDLSASSGSRLVDAVTGTSCLDLFSFFASAPLGINPPCIVDDPELMRELGAAAEHSAASQEAERRALEAAEAEFRAADGRIACFIAEPVQGEGGSVRLPANGLQQGLLYHALKRGHGDDAYVMQSVHRYHCRIRPDLMREAWQHARRKYPTPRLRFEWGEEPLQIVDHDDQSATSVGAAIGEIQTAVNTMTGKSAVELGRLETGDMKRRLYLTANPARPAGTHTPASPRRVPPGARRGGGRRRMAFRRTRQPKESP